MLMHTTFCSTLGACTRGTVVVLYCVCVSVTMPAATYLVNTIQIRFHSLGFLWHFQGLNCVDFVEKALFKSFGDIC